MRAKLKAAAIGSLLAIAVLPAHAAFHLMKVVEIFPGTAAAPSAQYVVIQMYSGGQQFVADHNLTVFNAAGSAIATFTFPGNVANGNNQAKILIATPQAEAFFGLNADLAMSPAILAAGGKVCFAETVDCVAWGAYSGSATGVGTPFNASGGLLSGRAAIRRLDLAGSSTVLDAADDTNNCANDFVAGLPAPRNNAGMAGAIPGATCGNGALEGLEQCDDHNLVNGDGCSSTCTVQPVTVRRKADFNGDSRSDILWRNASTGANVIWRSATAATQQSVTTVSNLSWNVAAIGDFNGDLKSDILWRNDSTGGTELWYSAISSQRVVLPTVTNLHWKVVGAGDFNGDGRSDVLWRNGSTGANAIWRSANVATQQGVATVSNLAWQVAAVDDFNGDRKADILWRNASTGANAIWRSANVTTQQGVATVSNLSWKIAGAGDFNADGKADILWRDNSSGVNVIWRSANAATQQAVARVSSLAWQVAAIGDYNGDGRSDIVWRNGSTGGNELWYSANVGQRVVLPSVTNLSWKIVGT